MYIAFYEVEAEDRARIEQAFPGAATFAEPLSAANVGQSADAEIVCGMVHSDFSAAVLSQFPNLKFVVTRTAGFDHIDLNYCKSKNIAVANVPDYGAHVIAEHVFALLLASARNVLEGEARTARDDFSWQGLRGMALAGKTFGVVGTGRIGSIAARIASQGFGMRVLAFDPFPRAELAAKFGFEYVSDLSQLLAASDVVSLHVPLSESTKYLINQQAISQMKDGAVLINTARGGLIDTAALVAAVRAGKLSRVALDVIENEQNPTLLDRELLELPNVLITPHIGFYADDAIREMYDQAFRSIRNFLSGQPIEYRLA